MSKKMALFASKCSSQVWRKLQESQRMRNKEEAMQQA